MENYKFISNIYNPNLDDADEKLLSPNYGVREKNKQNITHGVVDSEQAEHVYEFTPEQAIKYVREFYLKDKILGEPIPPKTSQLTTEDLLKMGYMGVYGKERTESRHCAPSTGVAEEIYPKSAVYDATTGEIIRVLIQNHTV